LKQVVKARYPICNSVNILLLSFDEAPVTISQMKDYRPLYDRRSFGTDGTVLSQRIMDDASKLTNHLKIFSLMEQLLNSSKFNAVKNQYEDLIH
jgi:hypothetical protein